MRIKNKDLLEKTHDLKPVRWRLGQYIRLSKEDIGRGRDRDDSNSVLNQRALLDDYYRRHIDEFESLEPPYVDDGYTGTDTNRIGFQRLLSDIYSKKVTCVIVKDLSRLSRNYTDAGSLIENLFVQMNIRFISLSEGIDSYLNPDSVSGLIVPITNVINDNFCYQTSKKIRQVFDYKRRSGEFIGGFAAYGYMKNPLNKNALVVDDEAAMVVRSIYEWFLLGMSKSAIVRKLNDRGTLCPSEYKRAKGLNYHHPGGFKKSLWSPKTVGDILKNRLYIGDMVQGRQRIKSYKIHTQQQVPKNEWFVVPNMHEGIIEPSVFEKTQEILMRNTRTPPEKNELYLFSGFLRCADCGKSMSRSKVRSLVYYFCRTYKDQSKAACSKHSTKHSLLETAVLYALRQRIYLYVRYADILKDLARTPPKKEEHAKFKRLIRDKEKERMKIMRYKQAIYQDFKDGEISRSDFHHMSRDYEIKLASLDEALKNLHAEHENLQSCAVAENPFIENFKKLGNIEILNREILIALIDHIKVYKNGSISIKFKFSSEE